MGSEQNLRTFIIKYCINDKEYSPSFSDFLRKKIFQHKHIDPALFPLLDQYFKLEKNPSDKDFLFHRKSDIIQAAKKLCETQIDNPADALQLEFLLLLDEPVNLNVSISVRYKNHITILQKAKNIARKNNALIQIHLDLEGLIKGLKQHGTARKSQNFAHYKIIDTDHYWHLFMAGTDIEGSCQNVYGTPNLNKCLMAYVMDGKNRLLAILDPEGKIIARCILRILIEKETEKPILYREEFYPETINAELSMALEKLAIEKAKEMGLPLLTSESTLDSFEYGRVVSSLYSPAPFEYVDANFEIEEEGVFEIERGQVIYFPPIKQAEPFSSENETFTAAWELKKAKPNSSDLVIFKSGRLRRQLKNSRLSYFSKSFIVE